MPELRKSTIESSPKESYGQIQACLSAKAGRVKNSNRSPVRTG